MDPERAVIAKIVSEKSILPVVEARVNVSWFGDPEHSEVYQWVLQFHAQYGEVPGVEALEHEFPEYRLTETPEPFEYYLDELRRAFRYGSTVEAFEEAGTALRDGNAEDALKSLGVSIDLIQVESSPLTDIDITETGDERLKLYRTPRTPGIPSGFPTIDQLTLGFHKEQLVTLVGTPKAGKSAMMILMAIAAHNAAFKPLFITFEMSNEEQMIRHDAFRSHVSYNHLLAGTLTSPEIKRIERMNRSVASMLPMIFIHDVSSTTTVSAIASKISQHRPDIVFVDGVYLMDTGIQGLDSFTAQGLTSITRSMKKLAQRARVVIVQSTQVLPGKFQKRRGVTMDSIGYSSSFVQDSDLVFGVEYDEDRKGEVQLRAVVGRNIERNKVVRVSWDWEHGVMEEIEEDEEDDEDRYERDDRE